MKKTITILITLMIPIALAATFVGIFSGSGGGSYMYESIRGEEIEIYGRGLYRHMSADVAIQGIAQDYITLFAGIPLLFISLAWFLRGSNRGRLLLAGVALYFFVTYLFYTAMGMYNPLFLAYVALTGLSLWVLLLLFTGTDVGKLRQQFKPGVPARIVGGFLVFNASAIALLWLSVIVPPLLEGTIYPDGLDHYTTMIVQGLDLALMLPLSIVSGVMLWRHRPVGYMAGTVFVVFLSLLMSALTAKLVAMSLHDVNVVPAIFIIPAFAVFAIACSAIMLRKLGERVPVDKSPQKGMDLV